MRTVRVLGASLAGTTAELVSVEGRFEEADRERTEVAITGLPDPVTRESKGRLLSALRANGLRVPSGRLLLNLVPAARRKAGETLDLPLVLAAAAACGHLHGARLDGRVFLGEVGLDGELHGVPGGLAIGMAALERGVSELVGPLATAREAAWLPGLRAIGCARLRRVVGHLCDANERLSPQEPQASDPGDLRPESLDEVRGQGAAKFALAVAAAGGHGLLLVGPPGAGKSLLARRLIDLLPAPTLAERLDVTRVLSACGRWPRGLCSRRPLRAPHHSVSYAGLVGGGSPPGPGEITLAHRGVLFLDELAEFRRDALEALRQPIETGRVLISRAGRQTELPARFQLVAAMNPCPCGDHGNPKRSCRCPPSAVERYARRVSGPLLDRIELRVEMTPPSLRELSPPDGQELPPRERGEQLAAEVRRARLRSRERQGGQDNAGLSLAQLERHAPLDRASRQLLERAADRRSLSARALVSLRRVARSVADLADRPDVGGEHVARALALRAWGDAP